MAGAALQSPQQRQDTLVGAAQGSQQAPLVTAAGAIALLQGAGTGAGTDWTPAVPNRGTDMDTGSSGALATMRTGTGTGLASTTLAQGKGTG